MVKVLFVCLGNICRSPMAEFVFKDMVKKAGFEKQFYIASAATSSEAAGCDIHSGTKRKLAEQGIPYESRKAVKITLADYAKYDYIIVMEQKNLRDIKKTIPFDTKNKIHCLLDFCGGGDIADPWYTGNFDLTYNDIVRGCKAFLQELERKNEIISAL